MFGKQGLLTFARVAKSLLPKDYAISFIFEKFFAQNFVFMKIICKNTKI